jgi:CheY-like chemotaxis protein
MEPSRTRLPSGTGSASLADSGAYGTPVASALGTGNVNSGFAAGNLCGNETSALGDTVMPIQIEKRRVLIVDDDRSVADTLSVVFSYNGYLARAVYSAEEALAIAPDWRPDLAILDVELPGMDGIVLARVLKATYPNLKLALLSGQPSAWDMLAKVGSPFELMMKPVHPSDLLRTAARLLRPSPREQRDTSTNHRDDTSPRSAA